MFFVMYETAFLEKKKKALREKKLMATMEQYYTAGCCHLANSECV